MNPRTRRRVDIPVRSKVRDAVGAGANGRQAGGRRFAAGWKARAPAGPSGSWRASTSSPGRASKPWTNWGAVRGVKSLFGWFGRVS